MVSVVAAGEDRAAAIAEAVQLAGLKGVWRPGQRVTIKLRLEEGEEARLRPHERGLEDEVRPELLGQSQRLTPVPSLANHLDVWLRREDAGQSFANECVVVDQQNAADPHYRPMAPGYDGIAFQAALDLVLEGRVQPNGYTEPLLHARRAQLKSMLRSVA